MESIQKSLQDISSQTLLELLHSCVDEICEKKPQYRYENFKSCTNWSKNEYDALNVHFKRLILRSLGDCNPEEKILEQHPGLSSDHVQSIRDCLTVRKTDIANLVRCKSHSVSGPILQDYDWKLKWVMGSSALSSLREPLLLIDFNLLDGDSKCVSLELNGNELKTLLSALEKAQENIKNVQN